MKWEIFRGNKNKNRKQSGGGYYQNIQHQITISSVLSAEGGGKIMTFGMENIYGIEKLNLIMEEVGAGRRRIRNWSRDINKIKGGQFHHLLPIPLPRPCPEVRII